MATHQRNLRAFLRLMRDWVSPLMRLPESITRISVFGDPQFQDSRFWAPNPQFTDLATLMRFLGKEKLRGVKFYTLGTEEDCSRYQQAVDDIGVEPVTMQDLSEVHEEINYQIDKIHKILRRLDGISRIFHEVSIQSTYVRNTLG